MWGSSSDVSKQPRILERLKLPLALLVEAYEYSQDTSSELWDFAIEIQNLRELGITDTDLRWLVRKGCVQHAREVTVEGDNGREFRSTGDLTFCARTCFVLTETGVAMAQRLISEELISELDQCFLVGDRGLSPGPHWDPDSRQLSLSGQVVKRFKWQALNQEAILNAFQEEDWPVRIDDPLPPHSEQDSKRRLADTIKCLNAKQQNRLIRFHGDGTGEGITWERMSKNAVNREPL